jgi:hypothetical protein
LVLAAAAALVLVRAVDFAPPEQVRLEARDSAELVGDAPTQGFSAAVSNPQAVQLRATLRLFDDPQAVVAAPDPELDARGKLLSQPVVTTILGMSATIDQTVRLRRGALEIDLVLHATPRAVEGARRRGVIELEHELQVRSRTTGLLQRDPIERVHLDTRAVLAHVDDRGHRVVFRVDEHMFTLDLELHRPTMTGTLSEGAALVRTDAAAR